MVSPNAACAEAYPILDEEGFRAHHGTVRGVALDIDETLSWTVGYWMESMQRLFGNPEGLTPKEMASKYHLCQHVPYWAGRPEVEEWMAAQRANNALQEELPVLEGAVDAVAQLQAEVPVVAYMTVRPQSVLAGTRVWLRRHGFPDAPILGKPDGAAFADGNAWKGALLARLYPQVLGLVDDNPSVLRAVPDTYPGTFFWFGGTPAGLEGHSGCSAVACPDWPSARQAVCTALRPLLHASAE